MLNSGALLPANMSLAPSYDFQTENPWVYQEDHAVWVERVDRPRMFPHVNLPQVPELSIGDLSNIDISLVEELHNVTGRFLSQVRGQPASVPASTISTVPAPTSTIQSSDIIQLPELVPGSRTCPVCSKVFREINKLKIHYATQHKRNLISLVSSAKWFWVQQLVWQLTLTVFTSTGTIHASIANILANTKGKSPTHEATPSLGGSS